jgi:hypothetical protein
MLQYTDTIISNAPKYFWVWVQYWVWLPKTQHFRF